jgi:hypothetical protein
MLVAARFLKEPGASADVRLVDKELFLAFADQNGKGLGVEAAFVRRTVSICNSVSSRRAVGHFASKPLRGEILV